MSSPTQRSLKLLRDRGYVAQVVERWNPHARVRHDLFGIIDVLAIRDGEVLGVQACNYTDVSKRVQKIADSEHVDAIRKAGIGIHVHGWRKVKGRYQVREVDAS